MPDLERVVLLLCNSFIGPSSLTVESLKKHDIGEQDSAEFDAQTFKTWATDFTCVSNATFGSVLRMHPNSAHQREVIFLTHFISFEAGCCFAKTVQASL